MKKRHRIIKDIKFEIFDVKLIFFFRVKCDKNFAKRRVKC